MEAPKIFESEYRFCLILWEHEPINSTHLVELCRERLGWSKATTDTVIRRLSERGVVKNENAVVTALVSKEQAQASRLDEMVEQAFDDQCTGANPRYPLMEEIKEMYLNAYYGK